MLYQSTDVSSRGDLERYYVTILQLLLTRLDNLKTEVFKARFVRFYHLISAKDDKDLGTDFFISLTEQIQTEYVLVDLIVSALFHIP